MNGFLAGWMLVLQTAFWGLGLTLLLLPLRWRRFWPGFVGPLGLALQSAVVWGGAHTTLPGTDSYALPALLIPSGLLAGACWRSGARATVAQLAGIRRWWVLLPILSISLALQIAPFTKPPGNLTVLSLGSCDAADYAAGARVFKEFSSRDRSGFLGQPEQVRGLSVDNFYDFWLRINHFTPSALIALDASLLRRQPYELTSLLGIVFILLNLPVVFWLGRSLFRFGPLAAAAVTLLYGCSPVVLYAMGQVALGQLLAAPAVALILWTCWQADRAARRRETPGKLWAYFGLLLAGNSLLMGSYNFFVIFAYVPLVAFVGARVLVQRHGGREAGRLAAFIAVNLLVCALLFPERFIGLGERFFLFSQTAFGWRIPALRPDGWYGMVGDAWLHPGSGWSLASGLACLLASGVAAWSLVRAGSARTVGLAAACVLPIFCGYGILTWEEVADVRKNASYDAYKMFSVFYPVLLLPLCLWMAVGLRRSAAVWARGGAGLLATVLLAANVLGAWRYNAALRYSSYSVGPGLSELSALEHSPEIAAVNIHLQTVWDTLWANQFLLHRPQYLLAATYEGRAVLPPRSRWDLFDRYVAPEASSDAATALADDPEFVLADRQGPDFVETRLLSGWYPPEQYRGSHWCWGGPQPVISIENPRREVADALLSVSVRSVGSRQVSLFAGDTLVWKGQSGGLPHAFPPVPLRLPPGETRLRFETVGAPDHLPRDARALTFALYAFRVHLLPGPARSSQP